MIIRFARPILRPVRRTRRAPLRAVRRAFLATLRPTRRTLRATLRPVRRGWRAVRRETRLALRTALLVCLLALAIVYLLRLFCCPFFPSTLLFFQIFFVCANVSGASNANNCSFPVFLSFVISFFPLRSRGGVARNFPGATQARSQAPRAVLIPRSDKASPFTATFLGFAVSNFWNPKHL
jgi:hypothetical protein